MIPLRRLPLFLRNLIFFILQPGIVLGVIPFILLKNNKLNTFLSPVVWHKVAGCLVFFSGVFILLHCVLRMAFDGKGTLSPLDPTKELVTTGLYKISRNPMYIGAVLILMGEVIATQSLYLFGYLLSILILFHLYIICREEPRLRRDFGEEYDKYQRKVRRWI